MTAHYQRLRTARSRPFDLSLMALGLALLAVLTWRVARDHWDAELATALVLGVPAMVAISRFPLVVHPSRGRGTPLSFESVVLLFMLSTIDPQQAVVVWAAATTISELVAGRRGAVLLVHVGVAVLTGGAAAAVMALVGRGEIGTARDLLPAVLAITAFFALDHLLTSVDIALDTGSPLRSALARGASPMVFWSFIGVSSVGHLAAVVDHYAPSSLITALLAIPLATVIAGARAISRSGEDHRRVTTLMEAAVRAQTSSSDDEVLEAVETDARRLLRSDEVGLRGTPPGEQEIGSQLVRGSAPRWVVAQAHTRSADVRADQQGLDALAAIAGHAFERLRLTGEMVHYARHDPLTDLPNRGILQDRATHALQLAKRRGTGLALLFLDLDSFKPVNDRFGHAAGDQVLVEVAARLRGCVRESDTVARLGGDEFAVLLEDTQPDQAMTVAGRMLAAIERGVSVGETRMPLSVSVGIAFDDTVGLADSATERILRHADLAMYEAKARGKGRVVVYAPEMGHSRLRKLELAEALRQAVSERRIEVAYQPMVDPTSGRIEGVEALARWRWGEVEVSPLDFIAVAEEQGLIVALGEVVLNKAADDAVSLRQAAGRSISMSVNISVQQLRHAAFVDLVGSALERMGDVQLVLEVTEREGIGADVSVHEVMRELHALGAVFAIDDFGTGFASVGYLQDVPAQILKADRALARDIDRDERACVLLRAVARMGSELGMTVVIEGIERDSQLATVRDDVHAHFAQGFYLHRPMSFARLVEVVGERDLAAGLAPPPEPPSPTLVVLPEPPGVGEQPLVVPSAG